MTVAAALRLVITGRVQGVGFRAWTRHEARRRRLRGWVRNRFDGSVEALLIGAAEAVEALAQECARGPSLAQVEAVRRFPDEDDGSPDFSERATA
ncbi:MAG TPA: acylphosphatase [Stellaceae bacterium]|nr:acylphosphatase [Stellaceae bacterium]